jgi:hypothetical protein
VFDQRDGERRYVTAARGVERLTPSNAVMLSMQHSGSLRYCAHRLTLRYDRLPAEWLDRAIASLQEAGHAPYVVLDDWEVERFCAAFGAASARGQLRQKPLAEFAGGVRLYDLTAAR